MTTSTRLHLHHHLARALRLHRPTFRTTDVTGVWIVTGAAALATAIALLLRWLIGN